MGLQRLYDELNRQFFHGRLPRYRVAFTTFYGSRQRGRCVSKRRLILVRRGLDGEELRRVLLHEMCHIGALGHGQRWQSKLRSLAEQGESWADEEAKRYAEGPTWNRLMVNLRLDLDDWALQFDRPPQFAKVIRFVGDDFGLNPREVLKKIPWLKAAWRKACREAHLLR